MIDNKYLSKIKIFEHRDKNRNYNMNIFTYIPEGNIDEMKIVFVMSGCYRDALNYLKIWIESANKNKYIIIAPEFDKPHYSIAEHEYGNIINIDYDYCTQDIYTQKMIYDNNIKNESDWIYHNIDEIYIEFIKEFNIKNNGYIMFGHSSGSQFTHRFLMFGNSKYCKKYLCANAGLYTFYDTTCNYPYGIQNLNKYKERIDKSLTKNVYILAGEQDVKSKYLNALPNDLKQGKTRYERATNYFNSAINYAKDNNIEIIWKFISMPDVHHSSREVVPFAVKIINGQL